MELNNAQLDAEVIALDARRNGKQRTPLLIHSKNFIADFAPPDYLIEGIARKRFLYSFTGQTGSGKTAICLRIAAHVALGLSLANREIDPGRVLYLAGENPDDVRMRWIAMSERMGLDDAQIYFIGGRILISENLGHLRDEALEIGGADLVVVDTSAAFFEADDENDNTKMLAHAHLLRSLTGLPGAPCVIAACHPTKGASNDNLIPRGGGAFLNEMDGNLVAKKTDSVVEVHWQGKFRGPDFAPIIFELETATSETLRDSKGRSLPTVMAKPVSDEVASTIEAAARKDEDALLTFMLHSPSTSIAEMAKALGWFFADGSPAKSRVQRNLKELQNEKLVTKQRGSYQLTERGKEEARKCA